MDLALNNQQMLICHKTQQTKPRNQLSTKLRDMDITNSSKRNISYIFKVKKEFGPFGGDESSITKKKKKKKRKKERKKEFRRRVVARIYP